MAIRRPTTDITQYRRHKRRAGSFRWVLVALLFLACAAAGYFFSLSPFFAVEQVIVSGNQQLSEERLRQLAGIEIGQNIFSVDMSRVERWLTISPLVYSAQVGRHLPRTLTISVVERQPAAVLFTGQAFVEIDNTGLVLRRMRELTSVSLPIISGVTDFPAGIIAGSRIEDANMSVALTVLNTLPEQAAGAVTEIDVTDNQKIRLYTTGGVEVRVGGSGNMGEKYVLAANIIYNAQMNGTAANICYIDISSTEKPVIYYYK